MRKWYQQIPYKPTDSAGGMTILEKIENVMWKDKSVEQDVLGSSIKG